MDITAAAAAAAAAAAGGGGVGGGGAWVGAALARAGGLGERAQWQTQPSCMHGARGKLPKAFNSTLLLSSPLLTESPALFFP